ncbi:hypothetical protein GCM10011491_44740 [Brucella endophytica]|uniref:Uncharacterized protein n=1 Tax=Brucella endophytica TaxID=1963359 RepID=A0A916WMD7_9HYPH|nr:hypothetical protein [Brucella endophytica]GGB11899.1 hypothetical protein GCM10011491_44740 [Brucella endophytica]
MVGNNDLTWITAGTAYPIQDGGDSTIESVIWVKCTNQGTSNAGQVRFDVTGPGDSSATVFAKIIEISGVYVARMTLILPDSVTDGENFILNATPVRSDRVTEDGAPAGRLDATAWRYDPSSGKSLKVKEAYAKTPGDATKPGYFYTLSVTARKKNGGGAIPGAAVEFSVSPSNNVKLYSDSTLARLPALLPDAFYLNTDAQGQAIARIATTDGINIQWLKLESELQGTHTRAETSVYFSTTPDYPDAIPGWQGPSLPDAVNGVLTLPDDGQNYKLAVPINDPDDGNVTRHVIINDQIAFPVSFTSEETLLLPDTHLIFDPSTTSNTFTVFSQDASGSILSAYNQYGVSGTPWGNMPNPDEKPKILPEALIDPDPANRILTKNYVNAHDGLGIALNPITISMMGPSDLGGTFDINAMADTTAVFRYYMNGYEAPNSLTIRKGTFSNLTDDVTSPVPAPQLSADKLTLEWTQPFAILQYALSVGWFQNASAIPPRQQCGFDYYIQQIQNGQKHHWYSLLTSQTAKPYTANISE